MGCFLSHFSTFLRVYYLYTWLHNMTDFKRLNWTKLKTVTHLIEQVAWRPAGTPRWAAGCRRPGCPGRPARPKWTYLRGTHPRPHSWIPGKQMQGEVKGHAEEQVASDLGESWRCKSGHKAHTEGYLTVLQESDRKFCFKNTIQNWWYFGCSTEAELRQAVLAAAVLEHHSVNKASLIYTKIICAKITCISILNFTIKPDDYRAEREKPPWLTQSARKEYFYL